jgi:hypothetical protein
MGEAAAVSAINGGPQGHEGPGNARETGQFVRLVSDRGRLAAYLPRFAWAIATERRLRLDTFGSRQGAGSERQLHSSSREPEVCSISNAHFDPGVKYPPYNERVREGEIMDRLL